MLQHLTADGGEFIREVDDGRREGLSGETHRLSKSCDLEGVISGEGADEGDGPRWLGVGDFTKSGVEVERGIAAAVD